MGAAYDLLNPFLQSLKSPISKQDNFINPASGEITGVSGTSTYQAPDPIVIDSKSDTSGVPSTWTGLRGGTGYLGGALNGNGVITVTANNNSTVAYMGNPDITNTLSGGTNVVFSTSRWIQAQRFTDFASQSFFLDPAATGTSLVTAGAGIFGGKVTATGYDPPYEINGQGYSTYCPSMIGVKEEMTGTVYLERKIDRVVSEFKIDFSEVQENSDFWLFKKITDLGEKLENLCVLLTAEGFENTHVWYEKQGKVLFIRSYEDGEVSFRLTAPRFDWEDNPTKQTFDDSINPLRP